MKIDEPKLNALIRSYKRVILFRNKNKYIHLRCMFHRLASHNC